MRDEAFSRVLRGAQRDGRLPAVVAGVFRAGELLWSEAIGLADVEEGVEAIVVMAMIGSDGPTGTFTDRHGVVAW